MKLYKKLLFALVVLSATVVQAVQYVWTDDGEGNWNDGSKWHKYSASGTTGTVPGFGDSAVINTSVTGVVINIDGEYEISELQMFARTADPVSVVTLKGNGKLVLKRYAEQAKEGASATTLQIGDKRMLIMDGPDVYCSFDNGGTVQYCEGGTLVVRKGTYTPTTHYLKIANGRLVVDGGVVTGEGDASRQINLQNGFSGVMEPVAFLDLKSGLLDVRCNLRTGTFTMTGGVWDRSRASTIGAPSGYSAFFPRVTENEYLTIDIRGGERIVLHENDTPPNHTLWPIADIVRTNSNFYATWMPFPSDGEYSFRDIIAPRLTFWVTNNVVLTGRTLDVNALSISNGAHDVEFNVHTVRVHAADSVCHTADKLTAVPISIDSRNLVRFESETSYSTMRFLPFDNTNVFWRFRKGLDVRLTAADGTSAANFYYGSAIFGRGATLDFHGVGTATLSFSRYNGVYEGMGKVVIDWFSNQMERVSIAGGGTLKLENWSWNAYVYPLQTELLVLGEGSKLSSTAAVYAHVDANDVELAPSGEMSLLTLDTSANSYFPPPPIMTGPRHVNDFQTSATRPSVTLATAGAADLWNFEWINGQPVVWRKDVPQRSTAVFARTKTSKWRGTVDGDWSNSANWLIDSDNGKEQAEDPLEQAMLFDGGYTNTRITVNNTVEAYSIYVLDKTAPVAFVGNGAIKLGSTDRDSSALTAAGYGTKNTVGNMSVNPLVFDVPVSLSDRITANRYFTVNQASRAYVAFMKSLDGGDVFTIKGDVRIGGAATAKNILFNKQGSSLPSKRTRLSVIPGGSFTATRQNWMQSGDNVEILVYSNATFTVQKPDSDCFWGCTDTRRPIWVKEFGTFDCRAPLGGAGMVSFTGKGEVRLADTGSKATAEYPVELEDVTFAIDAFAAGHPVVLKGSPTWASKADWTYALDPVSLPAGETLTVDTGDLDTGAGHSAAIDAALSADKLVKKGAGTLALGSSGNAIGEVSVEAGTLSIAASQSFMSLVVASGAGLQIASGVTVALSGSIDLTDVTVAAAVGKNWATILTVPEGSSITGVQSGAAQPFMTRVVETGSGLALQMRRRPGIAVSFR